MLLRDTRNEQIELGSEVAYNLSGQVAKGVVIKLPKQVGMSRWGHYNGGPIHVELLHDAAGMKAGHVSKVRNPLNMLVIEEV